MKKLLLIGIAVPAGVTVAMLLIMAGMVAWDRYYWWAAPDLAKAFRGSLSEQVRAEPIERLKGLSVAEAQAHVEAAQFSCLPRRDRLHCTRFVPEMDCGEDWDLILVTAGDQVSDAVATKREACAEGHGEDAAQ